jgi:PST family polysaccharide transporter
MNESLTAQKQPPPESLASPLSSLDHSLARGVAWTAAAKWSTQFLSWASLIIVARLLSPADFGVMGMAMLYMGFVTLFSEFGVGTAILVLRDLSEEQVGQLNSISVLIGVLCFGLSCFAAWPLAHFFKSLGIRSIPSAMLQREMRFKLLSFLETSQVLCQSLVAVVLAFFGFRYWSLVLGNIAGSVMLTAATAVYKRHKFAQPKFDSIKPALRFTQHILIARLCWFSYSNADFLVAGRVLGPSSLGEYSFGWNLATSPIEKISGVLARVTPAVFSAVQTDHAALRRYLRILTEALGILTFPATFGLALVAREFVPVVLGKKWDGAIVPLQLLAFYASFRVIVTLLPQILNALRDTRFSMRNSIATALVMPTAFYIGSHWGTTGIAAAWIIAYPIVIVPLFYRTLTRINLSFGEYVRGVLPPLNASLVMAIAVLAVKWGSPSSWPLSLRLVLEILAGAVGYFSIMFGVYRKRMKTLWQVARSLRKKPEQQTAADQSADLPV